VVVISDYERDSVTCDSPPAIGSPQNVSTLAVPARQ